MFISSRCHILDWAVLTDVQWCLIVLIFISLMTNESPLDCKEIQLVRPKGDWSWVFIGRTDAEAETPILSHLMQRTDSSEKTLMLGRLRARGEGDDRGWDGWMASQTRWTWVWVDSRSWWWRGRPGVLRFMGSQRVGHDWATELNWTELRIVIAFLPRSQCRNFMAAVTICSDFGSHEKKVCDCFYCFPIYVPWSNGTEFHDLCFLNVEL